MTKDDVRLIQSCVDAALAMCGVRNQGAGKTRARLDRSGANKVWVRVHGMCSSPTAFASRLASMLIYMPFMDKVYTNGDNEYVIVEGP